VIRNPAFGHKAGMNAGSVVRGLGEAPAVSDRARLRALIDDHFDFIWRSLRRLGLSEHSADDATQRVFVVASRRLSSIKPGSERAFLFHTAVRVACSERRAIARRREVLSDDPIEREDSTPPPDELLDQRRARVLLEEVLASLDLDLRVVLVLFEFEGLTVAEIAETVEIPLGTAGSRLRRAREEFSAALKRLRRVRHPGSER
jgi:RNA polymerase sigma-70 factor, ECF subfamily